MRLLPRLRRGSRIWSFEEKALMKSVLDAATMSRYAVYNIPLPIDATQTPCLMQMTSCSNYAKTRCAPGFSLTGASSILLQLLYP